MSLINDALRKADSMKGRAAGATPSFPRPGPGTAGPESNGLNHEATSAALRPSRSGGPQKMLLALAGGTFVVACGVFSVGIYLVFFRAAAEAPPVTATVASANADPEPSGGIPGSEAAEPDGVVAPPVRAPAAAETATNSSTGTPVAEPPAPAPAAPAVDPARRAAVTTAAESNPEIANWVASLDITGVRTGEQSRVLMNNRVFSPGATVNFDYQLRLTEVTPSTLTFEDANGATYHLNF